MLYGVRCMGRGDEADNPLFFPPMGENTFNSLYVPVKREWTSMSYQCSISLFMHSGGQEGGLGHILEIVHRQQRLHITGQPFTSNQQL